VLAVHGVAPGSEGSRSSDQDASTGELFAQVNYVSPWTQVEPVLDSSRYFVLRVEGEGGKRASVGMGFQERGDAFDFNVRSGYTRLSAANGADRIGGTAVRIETPVQLFVLIECSGRTAQTRCAAQGLLAEGGANIQDQDTWTGRETRGRWGPGSVLNWRCERRRRRRRAVLITASTSTWTEGMIDYKPMH
jgi:hypothetical protein